MYAAVYILPGLSNDSLGAVEVLGVLERRLPRRGHAAAKLAPNGQALLMSPPYGRPSLEELALHLRRQAVTAVPANTSPH